MQCLIGLVHCVLQNRLCTDLQNLINERADIERSYARSLQNWAKKWGDLIDKGEIHFFCCETFKLWSNVYNPFIVI